MKKKERGVCPHLWITSYKADPGYPLKPLPSLSDFDDKNFDVFRNAGIQSFEIGIAEWFHGEQTQSTISIFCLHSGAWGDRRCFGSPDEKQFYDRRFVQVLLYVRIYHHGRESSDEWNPAVGNPSNRGKSGNPSNCAAVRVFS